MFYSHLANIIVKKNEPSVIDVKKETERILKRNKIIAEKVIYNDLLKKNTKKESSVEKIQKLLEKDIRLKSVKHFLDKWNYWRSFYFNYGPIKIKNMGQITTIEKIIDLCIEKEMNLNIFIACFHKSFIHRKRKPPVQWALSYGEESYQNYYEDVLTDIDQHNFEQGLI